ncbi:Chaperone protein [Lasiodiplodia theobromae]|uniref:Chaperone protein n=1 Tax=Lasiodiplodia theobromae TaxID=45133 RepID=UPI0015C2F7F5|nr:Chaperone protein [Lasiodiplodia theobromae]KAF4543961.1 Chaperone protein [Lasiodiplodia theobromae]
MCLCFDILRAFLPWKPAKPAAPGSTSLQLLKPPATNAFAFSNLPGEVRTEIYKLCVDSHFDIPFPNLRTPDITSILPSIKTPAICRVNRSTRAEALPVFFAHTRWAVTGGVPTPIGEESTLNGLNVRGMGAGLGSGPPRSIGVPDILLLLPPGGPPYDWVRRETFLPDDLELRTWARWCARVKRMGREAENGVSKVRIRAYAHALCRSDLRIVGGAHWNEFGLLEFDVDLVKDKTGKWPMVRGLITRSMVPAVDAAEVFLEELVAPLREKRVLGLLRVRDVKVLVETFTAYVAEMGLSEETKFLGKITF